MNIIERAAAHLRNSQVPDPAGANDSAPAPTDDGAAQARHSGRRSAGRTRIEMDWKGLRRRGLCPPANMEALLRREFQRVKRPLVIGPGSAQAAPNPANVMMVSSALPGEGKSYCTFNLALSLADELDYSVLLVDGDVAKRDISRSFQLDDHVGLMDALADPNVVIDEAIVDTDVSGLSILAAGHNSRAAVEQLSSQRMHSVIAELSADPSRIVLFDSSPLLATVEAQAIAYHAAQIVLVVKAGATARSAINAAISLIDSTRSSVNLILNQSVHGFADDYEGYYGLYYHGANEHGQ